MSAADMVFKLRCGDTAFDFAQPPFAAPDNPGQKLLRDVLAAAAAFDELAGKLFDQG